ncbi:MAG: pseudouridine synthase [Actinomycetota bacterium]
MNPERVQKVIAAAGLMSRRAAEEMIKAGKVSIGGRVAVLGDRVDPDFEQVTIDGVPIPAARHLVTYLLYKPIGVVSTASDPEGRPTVADLVPADPRVVPVGRLDYDSEGLLLLSNDGELIHRVTHPRFGLTKTYVATVGGHPGPGAMARLTGGVDLDDGPAVARRARILGRTGRETLIEVVMGEGRNREVRRMLEAVGHPVRRLVRTSIGPLTDRSLKPGTWRRLTNREVADLYRSAGEGVEPP